MLEKPPQGKPWVAWLTVAIWSLIIFMTIPLARTIGQFVAEHWGKQTFIYAVLASVAGALAIAIYYNVRLRTVVNGRLLWLLATAAVFVVYTLQLGKKSPEEAVHFVQYGVLSLVVFRALAFKRRDVAIYFAAALICGIIGTIDEIIQWLVPQRHWDLRDVWINFFAAALVQIAIAKGLKPSYIAIRPSPVNLRFLCRLLAVAAALMGACMLNTPARIAWYAERIPGLSYLKENESVMSEYGFRYNDPQIGIFRSRFSLPALEKTDRQRATEAAGILNIYQHRSTYLEFLSIYTPVSDPFLHEARVHLFSRDFSFMRAMEIGEKDERYAVLLTTAYRENQIMEKYFINTLLASDYGWPPNKVALAEKHVKQENVFVSWVSRHLITRFSQIQVGLFFGSLTLIFIFLNCFLERYDSFSNTIGKQTGSCQRQV